MKTLKITSILLISMLSISTYAQVRFAPRLGLNVANMTLKSDFGTTSTKSILGYNAGIAIEFQLGKHFSFEPSVLYSTKGTKYSTVGSSFYNTNYRINMNYVDLPLNFILKFGIKDLDFLINLGPYASYAISGKINYSNNIGSGSESIKIGTDSDKDFILPYDFGANAGVGLEYKRICFGLNYGLGLANIATNTKFGNKINNQVFSINLGYKLGKKYNK
jgi:hypothetical protein